MKTMQLPTRTFSDVNREDATRARQLLASTRYRPPAALLTSSWAFGGRVGNECKRASCIAALLVATTHLYGRSASSPFVLVRVSFGVYQTPSRGTCHSGPSVEWVQRHAKTGGYRGLLGADARSCSLQSRCRMHSGKLQTRLSRICCGHPRRRPWPAK